MFSSPFIPSMSAIAAAVTAAGSVVLKVDIRAKQAPRGKRENESKEQKTRGEKAGCAGVTTGVRNGSGGQRRRASRRARACAER
jgi:hypothetical protein